MIARLLNSLKPFAPLLIRVGLGAVFTFKGGQKLFGLWTDSGPGVIGLIDGVEKMGFPFPTFFAYAAACSEFFGGIALLLGALTSYACFFIFITMCVAFFGSHSASFIERGDTAFAYGLTALALMFLGSGPLALDNFARTKMSTSGKLTDMKGNAKSSKA